ncbi:hypothetical protein SCP_0501710 [Sparassis crispa]|uniref:Methyltransferase domain-containing protein n=1 Tax=Sparassis crispa TaxID=139825 RepID=A0A401GMZ9_9APHY|nr:hypothetical protein SCP_0501710 [Sparassis crispa]GBE83124.1 hypothetical protein SCP_0501710 [Sparassis crispa]
MIQTVGGSRSTARAQSPRRPSTSSGLPEPRSASVPGQSRAGNIQHPASSADRGLSFAFIPDAADHYRKNQNSGGGIFQTELESTGSYARFTQTDSPGINERKGRKHAHDSQFTLRRGKKHHTFTAQEVPYPRNYDRKVVDHDVWSTMWVQQLCGNIAWHVFQDPPKKVLDLGCGTGTWIVGAAKLWKETQFVGLDIVPLHPNLEQIGEAELASRITWVQANFLSQLPFPDAEFDYVRIKRIARGVPEHKWDDLFEEIARVMKHGGAFELFEEDLHFPGILQEPTSHSESGLQPLPSTSLSVPFERPRAPTPSSSFLPAGKSPSPIAEIPSDGHPTDGHPLNNHPPDMHPPEGNQPDDHLLNSQMNITWRPPVNPHDHSLLETIYNEMHAARFINLQPLALLNNSLSLYFKNVLTGPPLMAMFPPLPDGRHKSRHAADRHPGALARSASNLETCQEHSTEVSPEASPEQGQSNKRDSPDTDTGNSSNWLHLQQLIEGTEYVQVDQSRFFSYKAPSRTSLSTSASTSTSESSFTTTTSWEHLSSLFSSASPRISTDDPHLKSSRLHLQNHAVHFDLQSLNMHLSLQVHEVLACAEAMWDFVVDFQNSQRGKDRPPRDLQSLPNSNIGLHFPRQPTLSVHRNTILELTRDDFDELLQQFELDMSENVNFDAIIHDRLNWDVAAYGRSQRRKEFDVMCATWAQYQAEVRGFRRSSSTVTSPPESSDAHEPGAHRQGETGGDPGVGSRNPSLNVDDQPPAAHHSFSPEYIPPSLRLSRTIRVFVGWKA